MLKEDFSDGCFFVVRFFQRAMDPVKVSNLEVANGPGSISLVEGRSECSFGDLARCCELGDRRAFKLVLFEEL